MSGISPKLPLTRDKEDGYTLTHTYMEAVRQNLKNLILTNPGERIMDQNFGVGMKRYLFEQNDINTYAQIAVAIRSQVKLYMPQVDINDIRIKNFDTVWTDSGQIIDIPPANRGEIDGNQINVEIMFTVDALMKTSILSIGI